MIRTMGPKMHSMWDCRGIVDKFPRDDKLVVMGNFNAQVGKNVGVWKGVIGEHGEYVENDNGRRLLRFSARIEVPR